MPTLRSHLKTISSIATKDMPFLEKVMIKSGLEDIFDARDVTVIYRAIRDLMTTEAVERVADELHKALPTKDKALQMEIADLWEDTNPIVGFLARFVRFHSQAATSLMLMTSAFLARVKMNLNGSNRF